MANWLLFSDTTSEHKAVLINLDLVKLVLPATEAGTLIVDGMLLRGDLSQILQVVDYTIYPDV